MFVTLDFACLCAFLVQENINVRQRKVPSGNGYTLFNFHQTQETMREQAVIGQYRVQVSTTTSCFQLLMVAGAGSVILGGGCVCVCLKGSPTCEVTHWLTFFCCVRMYVYVLRLLESTIFLG